MIYCPSCRTTYTAAESEPPYSAIHTMEEPPRHLHPITREALALTEEQS